MKTARPWLILCVAVALAGYGCASGSSTTATTAPTPSSTPSTTTSAGTTGTTVGSTATSATTGTTASSVGTAAGATASAAGLTSSLGSLGLSGDQSAGAVGSVLSMAQGKLSPTDYGKVAAAVPGASGYVEKAEAANGGPVTNLDAAYSKLGISPEVGAQVTPLVVNGISKMAGPTVGGLLSSVIK